MRLLERDRELRLLRSAVDATRRGGGSVTVIEGPAGIGKSQLLRAVRRMARERGVAVLSARAADIERSDAFGVAGQLVPGVVLGDASGVAAGGLRGGAGEASVRAALVRALTLAAGEGPALLAVDDLQWCDRESLGVLRDAIELLEDDGCAIVLSRRPHAATAPDLLQDVVRLPEATVLRPRPLSEASVAALISQELGRDAHPQFVRACCESCGGNPFLLRELLLEIEERGLEPTAANAPALPALGPQAVAESVTRRLRSVSDRARALAEAVAVLGDDADAEAVASLTGRAPETLSDAAHELAAAAILTPGGGLAFAHAIVRAAILSTMRPSDLADRHRAAARTVATTGAAPEAVGRHLLLTDPRGDGTVVDGLRAAAARVLERGAPDAAAHLLDRALREPPDASERAQVELELGTALAAAGRSSAIDHLRAALSALQDSRQRADAALRLGRMYATDDQYADAEATLRQALAAPVPDLERRRALQAELLYVASRASGSGDWTIDPTSQSWLGGHDDVEPGGLLLGNLAGHLSRHGERRALAVALARRALADPRVAVEPSSLAFTFAAEALVRADHLTESIACYDEALPRLQARGLGYNRAVAGAGRARALLLRGRLAEALAQGREVLAQDSAAPVVCTYVAGWVAEMLHELGDDEEADKVLRLHFDRPSQGEQGGHLASGYLARAALRRCAGRLRDALADAERCGATVTAARFDTPAFHPWRSEAALALVGLGDRPRALSVAEEELAMARGWGGRRMIARALRTLAVCQPRAAVALLREAEAALAESEALLERMAVDVELGAALVAAGDPSAAREPLQRGLEAAERCGARPLATRAREALVAAGARPRRAAAGPASLTAAERRVTELAAAGLSNAEIAKQLVVSPTTVRTHLRTAFKKLDVHSRQQLAQALTAPEER